jgi:predicted metal-dependent hydrolase
VNGPQDKIEFQIKRSRRATADIIVERDGSVLLRVPEALPDDQIEGLVESKRYWIYKSLAEWKDLNASKVGREFKGGEGFLYLGRNYRLSLVTDQEVPLKLKDGRFCLARELVEQGDAVGAKAAFRDYYIERGKQKISERVSYFVPKVSVQPSGLVVKDLGNRWASCSPSGKLSFHWKCMMAPLSIIDYIVVHELCHFHFPDHSDAFWNEVDKVMPDYRERKLWLKKHGAGLDL